MDKIEEIYDNMQEKIIKEIGKEPEFESLWNELNQLDELLRNNIVKDDYDIFDDYLSKEAELIELERKKAFAYGYKLSNKLLIDSLRIDTEKNIDEIVNEIINFL